MPYLMKQKILCLGDDYLIKNADGQDVFYVDGRAFSFGDKLSFQDMAGNELAYISQKLFAWGKTYEVYRAGQLFAVVKKEMFTFFHCQFTIDVPGPNDYLAEGNFLDLEYTFTRSGSLVAQVSKRFFSLSDTYGIDIIPGEDDVTILAAAVVIDLCCHGDGKKRH
jgi:uncharacterized protein YxjI